MNTRTKHELALFAGAGGGILAGHLLGWRTVCAVENEGYAAERLMQRQNEGHLAPFPIWDDVHTFDARAWNGLVDVVSGGFPCQRFSTAHHGRPTAEDLWPQMRRIVEECEPSEVFAENVAAGAILSAADDLESLGYKTRLVALSAADLGADHIRERFWLRAYTDDQSELCGGDDAEMGVREGVCPGVWSSFPGDPRMADGLANRVDRYRATGNGQVPCVAALAWRLLSVR